MRLFGASAYVDVTDVLNLVISLTNKHGLILFNSLVAVLLTIIFDWLLEHMFATGRMLLCAPTTRLMPCGGSQSLTSTTIFVRVKSMLEGN